MSNAYYPMKLIDFCMKYNNTFYFSVSAAGARGGTGINAPIASGGGYVEGKFNFTEGEKLYIVVGQPGTDACSPSTVSYLH
jgi:anaplastic lymphoma kinase